MLTPQAMMRLSVSWEIRWTVLTTKMALSAALTKSSTDLVEWLRQTGRQKWWSGEKKKDGERDLCPTFIGLQVAIFDFAIPNTHTHTHTGTHSHTHRHTLAHTHRRKLSSNYQKEEKKRTEPDRKLRDWGFSKVFNSKLGTHQKVLPWMSVSRLNRTSARSLWWMYDHLNSGILKLK